MIITIFWSLYLRVATLLAILLFLQALQLYFTPWLLGTHLIHVGREKQNGNFGYIRIMVRSMMLVCIHMCVCICTLNLLGREQALTWLNWSNTAGPTRFPVLYRDRRIISLANYYTELMRIVLWIKFKAICALVGFLQSCTLSSPNNKQSLWLSNKLWT